MIALCLFLTHFFPIEETIPKTPFCYPGKEDREVILFDPTSSPQLDLAESQLLSLLSEDQSEEEILSNVLLFVRQELFDPKLCNITYVQWIIDRSEKKELPLEFFLQKKAGVCRHMALCTTLLLERALQEGLLRGEVFFIRDELPSGRHAWTLFLSDQGAWHIDTCNAILENGKTRAGFSHLCQKYGEEAMNRQKVRWQHGN